MKTFNKFILLHAILFCMCCCTKKPAVEQTVYVTESGTVYHVSSCRYISESCIPVPISEATNQRYRPCYECIPPAVQNDSVQPVNNSARTSHRTAPVKTKEKYRCNGITKKGVRCKRAVKTDSGFCFQHVRN